MDKRRFIKRIVKNGFYTREMIIHSDGDYTENIEINGDVHFYRYRVSNQRNIESFISNDFWASLPITFNDPYDGYLTFNIKKMVLHKKESENLIKDNSALYQINRFSTQITKRLNYVASLSEQVTNSTMWSHYADNAKGFAVEYCYQNLNEALDIFVDQEIKILIDTFNITDEEVSIETWNKFKEFHKRILPVNYNTKAFDYTDEMIKESEKDENINRESIINGLNMYNDEDFFYKNRGVRDHLAVNKNPNWSYEREWRVIVGNVINGYDHTVLASVPILGIYLGEFMSDTDIYLLVSAAEKKHIPIYQMRTVYSKTTNKLRTHKFSEKEIKKIIDMQHFFDFKIID